MKRFRLITRMAGITACLSVLTACATPSQMYWDAKVKEMCEKDGGVTVYEKVMLKQEEYKSMTDKNGRLHIPFEIEEKESKYYRKTETVMINKENPKIGKGIHKIIRRQDKKILGTRVTYIRSGGDILVVDHESSYNCNDLNNEVPSLVDSIFNIQGESK
jgi:hypothetical protein